MSSKNFCAACGKLSASQLAELKKSELTYEVCLCPRIEWPAANSMAPKLYTPALTRSFRTFFFLSTPCLKMVGREALQPVLNFIVFVDILKQLGASDAYGNSCDLLLLTSQPSRAFAMTASRRAAAIFKSTSEEVSTADCSARSQGAGVCLGGLQVQDGGVLDLQARRPALRRTQRPEE